MTPPAPPSNLTPPTAASQAPHDAAVRTPYEALGGAAGVRRLVDRFYDAMDELPQAWAARRLHPERLDGARESLFEFLSGWLGGPNLYVQKRGHPRLRMRHLPYAIGPAERDAWMLCMRTALLEQVSDERLRGALLQAFADLATHMINTPTPATSGDRPAPTNPTQPTV